MNNHFSKKIKILRNRLNMNQFEFSNFIGIKQPSLSTYERNISSPTLDVAVTIAQKCNVSLDWLCGIEYVPHFYTVADIIMSLKELDNIDGFKYSLKTDIEEDGTYSCTIKLGGEYHILDNTNCTGNLCKFLYDWETTKEQLSNLSDKEIKDNYLKMWLEKQIAYYSSIPVKTEIQAKADREYTDEICESLGIPKLELGDIE